MEGQLLAQITAPELDHQIAQAEATLSQTEATLPLSRSDGVKAGDQVILSPPVDLVDGSKVRARVVAPSPISE